MATQTLEASTDPSSTDFVAIFSGFFGNERALENCVAAVRKSGVAAVGYFDHERSLYTRGAVGLPSRKALGDDIRERSAGYRRLVMFGYSSGGFAALNYGLDLNAAAIVCHNAITTIDGRALKQAPPRLQMIGNRVVENLPKGAPRSIKRRLEKSDYAGHIVLHYAALRPVDAYMAFEIEDDPRVTLVRMMTKDHPLRGMEDSVPDMLAPVLAAPVR